MENEEKNKENTEQLNLFSGFVGFSVGKDELNIAEFPIAALARRINPEIKTLVFEDEIKDNETGKMVPRSLTITGSDLYGLPLAFDDEVILALINITRSQGFKSKKVKFTRHQIIQVLQWKNDGYHYKKIRESIFRWLGVTLYYENAWRNNEEKRWKTGGYNLITSVEWGKKGEPSQIIWGDEIFASFERGNLKSIDLDVYRQLSSPTAKRLFRFLDKRFGNRRVRSWKWNIEKLAFNKLGMRRESYGDVAQLKRQLLAASVQLEKAKVIQPRDPKERFKKISKGVWEVHFEPYAETVQKQLPVDVSNYNEPETKLINHGVSGKMAKTLVSQFGEERVLERIEMLEYQQRTNQAGWMKHPEKVLIQSIRDETYQTPKGYVTREEKAKKAAQKAARAKKKAMESRAREKSENARRSEIERIMGIFRTFPPEDQAEIKKSACKGFKVSEGAHLDSLICEEIEERVSNGILNLGGIENIKNNE